MEQGNNRRFFMTDGNGANFSWLEGEQSNSFSRSMEAIDITDKSGKWSDFVAGRMSATADVTVNLDDSATSEQHTMLASFHNGQKIYCFIGTLNADESAPVVGDMFAALITAANDTGDKDAIASRQFSLQVCGAPTHYPTIQ